MKPVITKKIIYVWPMIKIHQIRPKNNKTINQKAKK